MQFKISSIAALAAVLAVVMLLVGIIAPASSEVAFEVVRNLSVAVVAITIAAKLFDV